MTSFIAALAIVLSSMGFPGLEHHVLLHDVTDPVPCSTSDVVTDNGQPWEPAQTPDGRKISNGF